MAAMAARISLRWMTLSSQRRRARRVAIVDAEFQHPGQAAHVALVEPDAGGADDVLQDQRRLAHAAGLAAHEALLHLRAVVEIELAQGLGHQLGAAGVGVAVR
jgi:hypothetical protein